VRSEHAATTKAEQTKDAHTAILPPFDCLRPCLRRSGAAWAGVAVDAWDEPVIPGSYRDAPIVMRGRMTGEAFVWPLPGKPGRTVSPSEPQPRATFEIIMALELEESHDAGAAGPAAAVAGRLLPDRPRSHVAATPTRRASKSLPVRALRSWSPTGGT
jgi:hypothetical protein